MEGIDGIKEILTRYAEVEEQLDRKLKKLEQDHPESYDEYSITSTLEPAKLPDLEEAQLRNANLLKSFEISKARLRSRSIFSPVEHILQQAIENYRKKPALVPQRHIAPSTDTLSNLN